MVMLYFHCCFLQLYLLDEREALTVEQNVYSGNLIVPLLMVKDEQNNIANIEKQANQFDENNNGLFITVTLVLVNFQLRK